MKSLSGIFLLCALVTEGLGLKCFSCMDSDGDCTRDGTVCDSLADQSCTATLITKTIGEKRARTVIRSCGVCGEATSFNAGSVRRTVTSRCCRSHLCNDRDLHVTEDAEPNGLECFSCFNLSEEACARSTRVLRCLGNERYCFHDYSTEIRSGSLVVAKGCASESICRMPKASTYGVQTTSDPTCCKGRLCNSRSALPGLRCHSRLEHSEPLVIRCSAHPCKTLHVSMMDDGRSQELDVRGCGTCEEGLSFSSGTFSLQVSESCCATSLCNNRSIAEAANATLNGVECYGCAASGNNSCEGSTGVVRCVGEQLWCLYSSGTMAAGQTLTLRGCASPSACRNPGSLHTFGFTPGPDFRCCRGNRCNRDRRPASGTEQPMAAQSAGRDAAERPMEEQTSPRDVTERPIATQSSETGAAERPIAAQTEGRDLSDRPIAAQTEGRDLSDRPIAAQTASPGSGNNLAVTGGGHPVRASLTLLPLVLGRWLL
ncbi:urokinase plasminogen activator surface receptor-like [Pristis pectinata]|uniref:urokinase plasminogen activator surface receptor-like n=1 Tax=Pristis pectinata TaxID=685728 RepID=UPI00223DD99A|nr:urokinase plasminogen activator surface receptor-like [Pristis pectinata]